VVLVALVLSSVVAVAPPVGTDRAAAETAHRITLPIDPAHVDRVHWTDSWGAARSGGRSHIGVDMMGPKMVPLVAPNDSEVVWGRFDNGRGTIVRLRDTEGWEYQYIHLNNDTPGTDDGTASCVQALAPKLCETLDGNDLRRGVTFRAGELVGYLGDSGNAEWTGAHLHFEIYAPDGAGGVVPVNPTPFVDEARARLRAGGDPVGPFPDAIAAADRIVRRLEGRDPSHAETQVILDALRRGGLTEALVGVVERNPSAAMIDRLYLAFFQREPDAEGWDHWVATRGDGHRLEDIAEWFAESEEFQRRYGGVTFSEFLDRLYTDVLGRAPDGDGKAYWLGLLREGRVTRGTIVVYFTESAELRRVAEPRSELTVLHRALGLDRPTGAELEAWKTTRQGTSLAAAIDLLVAARLPG
jgi:hypothetical protein